MSKLPMEKIRLLETTPKFGHTDLGSEYMLITAVRFMENLSLSLLMQSKWLEVLPMHSTTADATVGALRFVFPTYGLPEEIVSDNGSQFILKSSKISLGATTFSTF